MCLSVAGVWKYTAPFKLNRKIIMSLEKRYYAPKGIIMEDMHIEMNETDLFMCCLLVG